MHRDLLKFRRGLKRGQIMVGVIIQPNYRETHYCYEHFRLLNERSSEDPGPLLLPKRPWSDGAARAIRKYGPFLMPEKKARSNR